jgi:hypothetical protein
LRHENVAAFFDSCLSKTRLAAIAASLSFLYILLGIRSSSAREARRLQRNVARGEAARAMPPVSCRRVRSGAVITYFIFSFYHFSFFEKLWSLIAKQF